MKKLSKKLLSVLLVIAMLVPTGVMIIPANAETEIEGIVEFNGHYYKCVNTAMKWNDAKTYCESLGGHLITISSSEENDLAMNLVPEPWDGVFIGMSDEKAEGVWEWVTGEPITFTKWSRGEPNNQFNEDYAGLAPYHGQWNDCGNEKRPFICEWDSIANVTGEHFPAGYDFETDRWGFHNFTRKPTEEQFERLFKPSKAYLLYLKKGNYGEGGNCYGMALTTIALMNANPSAGSFLSKDGIENINIFDINRNVIPNSVESTPNSELNDDFIVIRDEKINADGNIYYKSFAVSEYIHYALLTWLSTETIEHDKYDCVSVYNAVEEYVKGERNYPPIITIAKDIEGTACHSVLGIGIQGNKIIVNDSNHENVKCYLELSQENGDFTGEWNYLDYYGNTTEKHCYISWVDGSTYDLPYLALQNDLYLDSDRVLTREENLQTLSDNFHLFYSNTNNYTLDNNTELIRKYMFPQNINDSEKCFDNLYWLSDSNINSLSFSNIKDDNSEFVLSDNYSAIYATVSKDSELKLTVDDEINNEAIIKTDKKDEIKLSFVTTDNNWDCLTITLIGTANGDKVIATETEDGIQVTGLNDITVTYETADGTAETTAKVADGSTVNITVNDDENTVETDWQCKHPDGNHDGICDTCSEDFTKSCSCSCHSNAFMQFIHKILCFLYRLFGMDQYRYCGCGKAHW